MKVLMINGSPRPKGNTTLVLAEMQTALEAEGIEVETVRVGNQAVRGCIACNVCAKEGRCVFDDVVNELAVKFEAADKTMKVGAAVGVARRGGLTATWDELNKYFGISGMPIASGQYWNGAHGRLPGEAEQDGEGMQQMRTLARNMAFLIKGIALAKDAYGLPEREPGVFTNFVR